MAREEEQAGDGAPHAAVHSGRRHQAVHDPGHHEVPGEEAREAAADQ